MEQMWRKGEVLRPLLNPVTAPVQDDAMKTLFAKIMLAQVITVVLALLVVTAITRASLNRGFVDFLKRQEAAVLNITAPALVELYEAQSGWDFLRGHPENWHVILRRTRNALPSPGDHGRGQQRVGRPRGEHATGAGFPPDHPLHWLRSLDRLQLRDRLFLLDAERGFVAGARLEPREDVSLQEIVVNGETVGWIGFAPMGKVLPPEAQRFMLGQIRVLSASLAIGLGLAALLGFLLARHLSRPVRELAATVSKLSRGQYENRAVIAGRDEIADLAQTINKLAENLEKSRSARRRWMADISHELRTPVAILKGEIEALVDGVRQPDGRMIASLGEEIEQLAILVDDLQTLALSDAGALNLHREPMDLEALVRQVGESFRSRLAARDIALELHLPGPTMLTADSQRLRQLLQNLFENSVRYVESGGWVRVSLANTPNGTALSVEDSGPGVGEEQLKQLFDRFYRAEQGRSRAGGGSGLGLSICRNIAEAHGGSIRAERGRAGGLTITIQLPN
jgi:two-component system sensor histidine kinase BaeS